MNPENRQKMIDELNKGLIVKNKEMVQKKMIRIHKIEKFRLSFFDLNKRDQLKRKLKKI